MKKFEKVAEPIERDFYTIFMGDGFFGDKNVKMIHIDGYFYKSDSKEYVSKENPNGEYWANTQACWLIEPLSEFIQNLRADYNYVDDLLEGANQYQEDMTREQAVEAINHYFDGNPPMYELPYEEITEDTPCGTYVSGYGKC